VYVAVVLHVLAVETAQWSWLVVQEARTMWEEKRRTRSKGRRSRPPTEVGVVVLMSGEVVLSVSLTHSLIVCGSVV
jgi:hypothetical protein